MQLFYSKELQEQHKEFTFEREESRHIAKVLRKKEGDTLKITNGLGRLFTGVISFSNPNKCIVTIIESHVQPKRNYRLHIAVAPTKMNDRYEWFLEKATEIGIDEITPILCERSERKIIKMERLQRILQSAMKQSLQCYLPKINPAITFADFIEKKNSDQVFIAHCEDSKKHSLKDILNPKSNYTIMIGPEGDFSLEEIKLAKDSGAITITLGDTRLRTETAAIVAVHSISFLNE